MADEKSGDCSEMYCPFEYAWVDAPDVDGNFHKYAECSGKGICDRSPASVSASTATPARAASA
jgi:hypothetical protein